VQVYNYFNIYLGAIIGSVGLVQLGSLLSTDGLAGFWYFLGLALPGS
jgi:hypothetical protein